MPETLLLHPTEATFDHLDPTSAQMVRDLVAWFEAKGKTQVIADDHARVWYQDFLDAQAELKIFSRFLTPAEHGLDEHSRWDTTRIDAVNEVLGFYGLHYWYTWQVTILGLGPIWMSDNEDAKRKAAQQLADGEIFAFGLSEKTHGADIYRSDMVLTPGEDGSYTANGGKYYIGNGNAARMASTFGRRDDLEGADAYVFFAADSQADTYEVVKNVVASQNFVAAYDLHDHPVAASDVLHTGPAAWNAALNTINVGKFNLGWASIGIATHALYEAVTHAANRNLYGQWVTDFPHVQRLLSDAWSRLVAMRMFAQRSEDYFRTASADDRRYLLFNPLVKMQVTLEGEKVINDVWDVIAAKGFETNTFFQMAARDIRALPKLEGTVHVNLALVNKFLPQYLFNGQSEGLPEIPVVDDARDDSAFLFEQGEPRGLSRIQFHAHTDVFAASDVPNVAVFAEQVEAFKQLLMTAPPAKEQQSDLDLLLSVGQLFAMVPYAHLVLEQAALTGVDAHVVDGIFDVLVRDMSAHATTLHGRSGATPEQAAGALGILRRPVRDDERVKAIFARVHDLSGTYEMAP